MDKIIVFLSEHWALVLAFCIAFFWVLSLEMSGKVKGVAKLRPQEVVGLLNQQQGLILDLRPVDQFNKGHITGAKKGEDSAFDSLCQKYSSYKIKPVIVVCGNGQQSLALALKMRKAGFERADVLTGGIRAWTDAGLPLVT
jgi:rhodanese-related sulfurtransferase